MTTTYDPAPLLDRIATVTGRVPKGGGSQWSALCPAHGDRTESLSVAVSPDKAKIHCHAGCGHLDILDALGLTIHDLFPPREQRGRTEDADGGRWMPCGHAKVASYRYHDQHGHLVFGVARCARKGDGCQGFRQWRPDPTSKSGRKWSLTLPDRSKVGEGLPYRLPEVIAELAKPLPRNVWVPEGEKDADRLWSLGLPATCNAQGAGKWTPQHARWLAGADVMVVADRDKPGWAHAEQVVNSLMDVARSIEVLRAATGKDLSDHLDAGGTIDTLVKVAEPKPAPAIGPDGNDIPAGAR